ncbi:DUF2283 domain-containing protein [Paeniglutamicibacter psychrophenolicus]|uniref:DUF2283 domain-containing protein n=1 Tax=Paeniglutamicibacter psychrophenolicus TaxID=257454 RepID=UPI002788DA82|nr:DUF2283 domain-containing protein [Paeniglutamicibacter psychrophenolicus]MDQ0094622.1 uncharacterized protein YuzE [Paeniglutamicibacter psychrophenolicus]
MKPMFLLEVDTDADAAYIRLSSAPVSKTVEATSDVLIDLDEFNVVVGVEVLTLSAAIPFTQLHEDFHVRPEVVANLQRIRPTVSSFTSLTTGVDGVSMQNASCHFNEGYAGL